ncbi:uncharacterized protein LOC110039514 [Phalaenopsis equestris]|uniref:uncharacterized protein LOC110039514 n=1 Tax=Phalaenopsis equestris TaxID=78828 RepID=UPI0009E2238E|nr:uncharacterized protein LOC110039514 [Phalaenopsis equestris]
MTNGGMVSFQVPMLKESIYDNWSIKMKALLEVHDVWEVVEKDYDESSDESALSTTQKDSLRDLRKRDKKALFLIYQALDEDGFEKISSANSAKLAWKKLEVSYKGEEKVKKAETVACAVYLANRSPTRSVLGKTPQEAWSGRKLGISHLRVFGCITHVHIPDEKISKLNEKSEKFIFIGYDNNSKGYKLYNPNTGKKIISRDAIFDEGEEWDWGLHAEDYNFFPYFQEEDVEQSRIEEEREESTTPQTTSNQSNSSSSTSRENSSERVPCFRRLEIFMR